MNLLHHDADIKELSETIRTYPSDSNFDRRRCQKSSEVVDGVVGRGQHGKGVPGMLVPGLGPRAACARTA